MFICLFAYQHSNTFPYNKGKMDEDNNPFGNVWSYSGHAVGVDAVDAVGTVGTVEDEVEDEVDEVINQTDYIAVVNYTAIKDHVAYTIQHNSTQVSRRYSDFDSLRRALVRLFPTQIIPPLPEKHSMVKYLVNPLNAKNDIKVIEKRMRLLTIFLQRCLQLQLNNVVWNKFLDPKEDWNKVLNTPPVSIIPSSNLLAPPLDPTHPSPLHLLLPTPHSTSFMQRQDLFRDYEQIFNIYKSHTQEMESTSKRSSRHFKGLIKDLGSLGAIYNSFSLDSYNLSIGIEKTGEAIDINYINSEAFAFQLLVSLQEPISYISKTSSTALSVIQFRQLKQVQLHIIETTIKKRQRRVQLLISTKEQVERLTQVLRDNAQQSPTIADAVKRLDNGQTSHWSRLFNTHDMNDEERDIEIQRLNNELIKLQDCHQVILKDIEQVNHAVKHNCDELIQHYQRKWIQLMKTFTESILIWSRENLKAWQDAKQHVDAMDINPANTPT